jgi:hypothetical protein
LFDYVKSAQNYRIYVDTEDQDFIINQDQDQELLEDLNIYPVSENRVFRKHQWFNKTKKKYSWPYAYKYYHRYKFYKHKPYWWLKDRTNKENQITEFYFFFNSNNLSFRSFSNIFLLQVYLISIINLKKQQHYGYYKLHANTNDESTVLFFEYLFQTTFLKTDSKKQEQIRQDAIFALKNKFKKSAMYSKNIIRKMLLLKKKSNRIFIFSKRSFIKKLNYLNNNIYEDAQILHKFTPSFYFNFHENF